MVGAGGPECLGRGLVDLRSIAGDHREDEPPLGAGQHVPFEGPADPLSQRRRGLAHRNAAVRREHLDELRRLAVRVAVEAIANRAAARGDAQPRRHRHPRGVEEPRQRRLASDLDAHSAADRHRPRAALDRVDVEHELEAAVALDPVPAHGPDEAQPRLAALHLDEPAQRGALVEQPLDGGRAGSDGDGRGAERDQRGAALPRRQRQSERGRRQRQQEDGLGRPGRAVGEEGAAREPGSESEKGPAHGRRA